jgi:ubiquitin carboxyl-terminal hydrolase 8
MFKEGEYEEAYTSYIQAHHVTTKIIPSSKAYQDTMQQQALRYSYNGLLKFFDDNPAEETIKDLQRRLILEDSLTNGGNDSNNNIQAAENLSETTDSTPSDSPNNPSSSSSSDYELEANPSEPPHISSPKPPSQQITESPLKPEAPISKFKVPRKPVGPRATTSQTSIPNLAPESPEQANLSLSPPRPGTTQVLTSPLTPSTNVPEFPLTNAITAEQLRRLMKYRRDEILLLDIRPRKDFDNGRFPVENVVCIDPYFLQKETSELKLERDLEINPSHEQLFFQTRNRVELVVFYDQSTKSFGKPGSSELTPYQVCLNNLVAAIYEQARIKPLKRMPVLLIGGLNSWLQYMGPESIWCRGYTQRQQQSSQQQYQQQQVPQSTQPAPAFIQPPQRASRDYQELKTPQLPQNALSRDRNRKGSISTSYQRRSIDSSALGISNSTSALNDLNGGSTPNDYYSSGKQEFQVINGIVRPNYSHVSSKSVSSTLDPLPTPPAAAATNGGILQQEYSQQQQQHLHQHQQQQYQQHQQHQQPFTANYQRYSMPSLPSMTDGPFPNRDDNQANFPLTSNNALYNQTAIPRHQPNLSPQSQVHSQQQFIQRPTVQISFGEFHTGLMNLGNTCYMNSILQCLVGTTRLSEQFLNRSYQVHHESKLGHNGRLAHTFGSLVSEMYMAALKHSGRNVYIAPNHMKMMCGQISEIFRGQEQQDCHEFLNFLLDGLHEDLNKKGNRAPPPTLTEQEEAHRERLNLHEAAAGEWLRYTNNNLSPVSQLCQGQYLSQLQCRVCGCKSTTYNPFSCLSIPIFSQYSEVRLEDCFKLFTSSELLEGDDAWHCPRCKKRQPTVKTMRISRMPQYLMVHLKRFKHQGGLWGSNKLTTFVRYPCGPDQLLDLAPYWLPQSIKGSADGNVPRASARLASVYQTPPFHYMLYGVANHYGSLKSGHYTAYVDRGSCGWCLFDDARVRTHCGRDEVVNKNAYVLFYKRV